MSAYVVEQRVRCPEKGCKHEHWIVHRGLPGPFSHEHTVFWLEMLSATVNGEYRIAPAERQMAMDMKAVRRGR